MCVCVRVCVCVCVNVYTRVIQYLDFFEECIFRNSFCKYKFHIFEIGKSQKLINFFQKQITEINQFLFFFFLRIIKIA